MVCRSSLKSSDISLHAPTTRPRTLPKLSSFLSILPFSPSADPPYFLSAFLALAVYSPGSRFALLSAALPAGWMGYRVLQLDITFISYNLGSVLPSATGIAILKSGTIVCLVLPFSILARPCWGISRANRLNTSQSDWMPEKLSCRCRKFLMRS